MKLGQIRSSNFGGQMNINDIISLTTTPLTVAVHSGLFHADDAFAVAALRLLSRTRDFRVIRTRNPEELKTADIRVDVGGKYDSNVMTFDHHQRGGAGGRPNGVKYAGFGLVWRHFGGAVVRALYPQVSTADIEAVVELVDQELVQPVDAADNGQKTHVQVEELSVRNLTVSSLIHALNPTWEEGGSPEEAGRQFDTAVNVASITLQRFIASALGKVHAQRVVEEAIASSSDKRLVILDKFVPWMDYVVEYKEPIFVVFENNEGTWMVQCVPPEAGSFDKRLPLPSGWAGLRDKEFQDATGVEDAVFCHPGRFICGAKSRNGALTLAALALG